MGGITGSGNQFIAPQHQHQGQQQQPPQPQQHSNKSGGRAGGGGNSNWGQEGQITTGQGWDRELLKPQSSNEL